MIEFMLTLLNAPKGATKQFEETELCGVGGATAHWAQMRGGT